MYSKVDWESFYVIISNIVCLFEFGNFCFYEISLIVVYD